MFRGGYRASGPTLQGPDLSSGAWFWSPCVVTTSNGALHQNASREVQLIHLPTTPHPFHPHRSHLHKQCLPSSTIGPCHPHTPLTCRSPPNPPSRTPACTPLPQGPVRRAAEGQVAQPRQVPPPVSGRRAIPAPQDLGPLAPPPRPGRRRKRVGGALLFQGPQRRTCPQCRGRGAKSSLREKGK